MFPIHKGAGRHGYSRATLFRALVLQRLLQLPGIEALVKCLKYSPQLAYWCGFDIRKSPPSATVFYRFLAELNKEWYSAVSAAAEAYRKLLDLGAKPEEARGVLPGDLKAEIVATYNLREWRHFFKLRCSKRAHPQIRQIAIPTLLKFRELLPVVFDDLEYDKSFPEKEYAQIHINKRK